MSLGKGAWDCDANKEIPPEKEVRRAQTGSGWGLQGPGTAKQSGMNAFLLRQGLLGLLQTSNTAP